MKLFGTDGIRGLVNHFPIEAVSLVRLAYAVATHFFAGQKLKCIIGKDTRISGYMIESALVSGLLAKNVDVIFLGPVPSAAVAMLTKALKADFGIMISASHNPYYDNGIKIFEASGEKLTNQEQEKIEAIFHSKQFIEPQDIGKATRLIDASGRYIEFVKRTLKQPLDLAGIKIVLDCANGSGYKMAPRILEELGANVITIAHEPDGYNINEKCGATSLKMLSQAVVHYEADIGLALDGDADRLAVIDEKGFEIKGEFIFACLAKFLATFEPIEKCVVTSVTNPGLIRYLTDQKIQVFVSDVGDREVLALMKKEGCLLGGEPSGHYILSHCLTSSDGMITALQVLSYLQLNQKKASFLKTIFPLMNSFEKKILLPSKDPRKDFTTHEINHYLEQTLSLKNPYLVRKSGTESALRIHMWAVNENFVEETNTLVEAVERFLTSQR